MTTEETPGVTLGTTLVGKPITFADVVTEKNAPNVIVSLLSMAARLTEEFKGSIDKIDDGTMKILAKVFRGRMDGELAARLHEAFRHPDYEYESKEQPRRFGGDSYPPEGKGWVANLHKDNGMTRYDNTEDVHWMRLKVDAGGDDIKPSELREITLPKVKRNDYLALVRKHMCEGYMPSAKGISNRSMQSKPEYPDSYGAIAEVHSGTGVYQFSPDTRIGHRGKDWNEYAEKNIFERTSIDVERPLLFAIEDDGIRIIVNLKTDEAWFSLERKDGTWMKYQEWHDFQGLPINTYRHSELMEMSL